MRLNKKHKQALLNFALEKTTIDIKVLDEHDKLQVKTINAIAEHFVKKMGVDYSSLKRQGSLKELSRLNFRIYSGEKDRYDREIFKDYKVGIPKLDDVIVEVPRTKDNSDFNEAYYTIPKSLQNLCIKYIESVSNVANLKREHRQTFERLINSMTTFKRACEVFPEFENAAHIIMSNTQLVTTNAEFQKMIKQYEVIK